PEWSERADAFATKIKDITSILIDLEFHKMPLALPEQIVTYQDSCHLKNWQKTFMEPRYLLEAIDGVTFTEMKDANRCCGSAGSYNLLQYVMSMLILEHKMEEAVKPSAKSMVSANSGCFLLVELGIERQGL